MSYRFFIDLIDVDILFLLFIQVSDFGVWTWDQRILEERSLIWIVFMSR